LGVETPVALMLAPEAPYPLSGGGALRTASLLEYLARRYRVDLIVFRQPGAADPAAHIPAGLVRRLFVLDLPANRRDPLSKALRNGGRLARGVPPLVDRFAGFERDVRRMCGTEARYEIGVIEHSWCAAYWEAIAPACRRTALNLHNIESILHRRCAAVESGPAGLAHRIFQSASRALEREWLPRFSEVLAASEEDRRAAVEIAPAARIRLYPNALPHVAMPQRAEEEAVVFSGNLEYHPNISAVRFFRREVWPRLRERWPRLVWRLVGKNPGAVRRFTAGDARIQVTGEIPDAIAELARAKVAVAPLLAGSGTRLKILEAWAAGTPVVSTLLGAEGLPGRDGEHLLIAEGGAAFAEAVSRLLACNELRRNVAGAARLLMENEFTWEKAWAFLDF
jgi:glycosyltransferase involved in cell wall biosynthesis